MATDDKNPDSETSGGTKPPAGTDPDTGFPVDSGSGGDGFAFVDSDDDGGSGLVDLDYDEAFPGQKINPAGESPDPGYAAFADELDDPLADWPSPESRLEELPEMRGADAPAAFPEDSIEAHASIEPPTDLDTRQPDDWTTEIADWEDSEFPEAEFFDDPPEREDSPAETPSTSVEKAGHTVVDRDALHEELEPAVAVDEDPSPYDLPSTTAEESHAALEASADDARHDDFDTSKPVPDPEPEREPEPEPEPEPDPEPALEPEPEPEPEPSLALEPEPEEVPEELLVDDFLNDLDDIDEDPDAQAEESYDAGNELGGRYGDNDDEPAFAARQGPGREPAHETTQQAVAAGLRQAPRVAAREESPGRHWVMIAVVVVALALLAAGGYGVVQQRSAMQDEIRELQAQLATAVAPDEAAAEREQQRQMALQNESLGTEIAALEAENRALGEQIANLESQLQARQAAEETARAAAAAARAEAERAQTQAQRQSTASAGQAPAAPVAAAGSWFVNFGSYAQRDVADRWAAKISVDQGRVSVQEAEAGGRMLYRVRVVGLASRDAAERVATALEREYQLPRLWVGRS